MLALATTHDGDVPLFLRPLDGNSSDKEHLSAAVKEVMTQLRDQLPEEQEQRIAVFDSGGEREGNMQGHKEGTIVWSRRVAQNSTAAPPALEEGPEQGRAPPHAAEGDVGRVHQLPR